MGEALGALANLDSEFRNSYSAWERAKTDPTVSSAKLQALSDNSDRALAALHHHLKDYPELASEFYHENPTGHTDINR